MERKNSDKANKKFKSGIDCTIWAIIILVFSFLIILIWGTNFHDTCGNVSVSFSVFKSVLSITQIIVPLALLIKGLFSIINLTYHRIIKKDDINIKELKRKAVIFISLAILIFLAFIFCKVILGLITQKENGNNFAQCWCGK